MDPSQLECSICMEDYTAQGDHGPRLLMCGHSFCLSCLRDLPSKGDGLPCPTCRKVTRLPPDGVDGLSANYALIELLNFLKPKGGGGGGANKPATVVANERTRNMSVDSSSGGNRPRSQTVDSNAGGARAVTPSRGRSPTVGGVYDEAVLIEEKQLTPLKKPKESKYEQEKQQEQERLKQERIKEVERQQSKERETQKLKELERQQSKDREAQKLKDLERQQSKEREAQKEKERRESELHEHPRGEEEPILVGEAEMKPVAGGHGDGDHGVVGEAGEEMLEEKHQFQRFKCDCKCERPKCACFHTITKRDVAIWSVILIFLIGATAGFAIAGEQTFHYILDSL